MMIDLKDILQNINLSGTDLTSARVARTLELLAEVIGDELTIDVNDLPQVADSLKSHLEKSGRPGSTVRNERYRLKKALRLASCQGLICEGNLRFKTGFPSLERPAKKMPSQRRHDSYLAFERWCADRRIEFESISPDKFREYRKWLKNADLSASRKESLYSDLRRFWCEKGRAGLLPVFDLPRWNDDSRENYGLIRELWPTGCKGEFEAFERGAQNRVREGEKRWRGPLRKVSIGHMEREIAQFLGYLKNVRGSLPDDATLSTTLAERVNIIGYINWHIKERCGGKERKYHQNTLEQFAVLLKWLGGEEDTFAHYRQIANSLDPVRVKDPFQAMPIDYDEFVDAAIHALQAKKAMFEQSRSKGSKVKMSAACAFRDALTLALVVCRPLRSRNVREMELEANLHRVDHVWKLRFFKHQAKSSSYSCDFPDKLVPWLEFYLTEVRPILLCGRKTTVLLLTKSGRPLSPQDLWRRLRAIGDEFLGIQTNPHLFRYLIPSTFLAKYPNAIDQMQALLGHSTMQTTMRCYVHTQSQVASRKVADAIRVHCPNLTRLASFYPSIISEENKALEAR